MGDYNEFLQTKSLLVPSVGLQIETPVSEHYKAFQRDLVNWSLRKGRVGLFADTGLGKSRIQLAWGQAVAQATGGRVLILAPLAVAKQTVREGEKIGIAVTYARSREQSPHEGITVTNYEMLDKFNPDDYIAVILDESSILKSFEGKIRTALIERFANTPYRLCCTATPAPNDIAEIANHAEFLGVMSRTEMLAAFFVHDDNGWRLKGHAKRGPFYQWLASWSMSIRHPSDLGYSDDGYDLPPLSIIPHIIPSTYVPEGMLFHVALKGIQERAVVRKGTLTERVAAAAALVNDSPIEQWLVWCGLNDEGRALHALIPGSVLVEGSNTPDYKAEQLERFANGETRVLVTKPSIAGFGLNFQACANMVFVGLSDSYEQYYQAIRRCYRFGQTRPVNAHIVLSDIEEAIYHNVLGKEKEAKTMSQELISHIADFEKEQISGGNRDFEYRTDTARGEHWQLMLGDSAERLTEVPDHSIDLSVFSPPFQSLYTYSPTKRDLGNSKTPVEFWQHFRFISDHLLRAMKPGRIVAVHTAQIPSTKAVHGEIGIIDFRGATISHFQDQGFIYHGDIVIDKDPQAQAIRTHSKALLFNQLRKDSSWLRPALADYILLFRAPGDNEEAIHPDISNEEWIEWARPIWYNIRESDTLNVQPARNDDDERHICPLQLGTIERIIRLWSTPGETVLSPFAGIGSELYEAVRLGRNAVGCELKLEYFNVAVNNLKQVEAQLNAVDLFGWAE